MRRYYSPSMDEVKIIENVEKQLKSIAKNKFDMKDPFIDFAYQDGLQYSRIHENKEIAAVLRSLQAEDIHIRVMVQNGVVVYYKYEGEKFYVAKHKDIVKAADTKIRHNQIRECDIANGEGIGIALFVQGYRFACKNCFNPETWDFNGGKEWTPEVKKKFLELASRPYIKRISLLGGECLADENLDDVLDLVTEINKRYNFQKVDSANPCKMGVSEVENADKIRLLYPNKSIWLYSGYAFEECLLNPKRREILKNTDVMVDGKYIDFKRDITLKWRGSSNQRVINIKESLKQSKIVLLCI